jgi:hypothetical protein
MRHALSALLLSLLPALWGCPDDPTVSNDLGWIKGSTNGAAVVLDATSETEWTYLSFEKGVVPEPADPEASLDWDIAFQRYNVKTNGGTSGRGQAASSDLGDLDLEKTTTAQVAAWTPDALVADARTEVQRSMNAVLSGWYAYHFFKHELVSLYKLYAVRAADGRVALFKIHSYYDDAGTAGKVTVIYRFPVGAEQVEPGTDGGTTGGGTGDVLPDVVAEGDGVVSGETNFDARIFETDAEGKRVYKPVWGLFTAQGLQRITDDPGTGGAWDFNLRKWLPQTNSGSSGAGAGGAQVGVGVFEDARNAPADGWSVDAVEDIALEGRQSTNAGLRDWWDLDAATQKISAKNRFAWLRTHDGKYAKLQIVGYYHPDGSGAFFRLKWAYRTDGGAEF